MMLHKMYFWGVLKFAPMCTHLGAYWIRHFLPYPSLKRVNLKPEFTSNLGSVVVLSSVVPETRRDETKVRTSVAHHMICSESTFLKIIPKLAASFPGTSALKYCARNPECVCPRIVWGKCANALPTQGCHEEKPIWWDVHRNNIRKTSRDYGLCSLLRKVPSKNANRWSASWRKHETPNRRLRNKCR